MMMSPWQRISATTATIIAITFVAASALAGPDIDLSVDVNPDEVTVGGEFHYEVHVSVAGNFGIEMARAPGVDDFAVVRRSSSPTVSVRNGQATRSVTLNYRLRAPGESGKFTIAPPRFLIGDQQVSPEAVEVRVVDDGRLPRRQTSDTDRSGQDAFVSASLTPNRNPYVGEQLLVNYELWINDRARRLRARPPSDPALDDFWIENIGRDIRLQRTRSRRDGHYWHVTPLHVLALFPLRAGPTTIDSIEVPLAEASLFGRGSEQLVESDSLSLEVKPLPDGAPEGFSDANIGSWELDVDVDSQSARAGGQLVVTARITGRGRIERIGDPTFDIPESFRLLSTTDDTNRSLRRDGLHGTKTVRYSLMPVEDGVLEIPELRFSYFDPDREEYITRQTDPIFIEVEPGDVPPPPEQSDDTIVERGYTADDPSIHLHDLLEAGALDGDQRSSLPLPLSVFAIPLLGLLLLAVGRRITDPIRRRLSPRWARRRLEKQIASLLDDGDEPISARCLRALRYCLTQGLDLRLGALTTDEVAEALSDIALDPSLQKSTTELVADLVQHRYRPGSDAGADRLDERTKTLVDQLLDWHFAGDHRPHEEIASKTAPILCAVLLPLALFASMATPAQASEPEQESKTQERDWVQLYDHWSSQTDASPDDATAHFNAGTAAVHIGKLGLARLHLEQALALGADSAPVRQNLSVVTTAVAAEDPTVASFPEQHALASAFHTIGPWLVAAALWFAFLLALSRQLLGRPTSRPKFVLTLMSTLLLAAAATAIWLHIQDFSRAQDLGVVTTSDQVMREAPSQHATSIGDDELPAGAVVHTMRTRDGWTEVRLPAGTVGWLSADAVSDVVVD